MMFCAYFVESGRISYLRQSGRIETHGLRGMRLPQSLSIKGVGDTNMTQISYRRMRELAKRRDTKGMTEDAYDQISGLLRQLDLLSMRIYEIEKGSVTEEVYKELRNISRKSTNFNKSLAELIKDIKPGVEDERG